jgi:hypothetical protein
MLEPFDGIENRAHVQEWNEAANISQRPLLVERCTGR